MKTLCMLAASVGFGLLSATAQDEGARLSPPVNVVRPAEAAEAATASGNMQPRQSMVIEENGAVRFLTPEEAAEVFVPAESPARPGKFSVDLDQAADGPDSLTIEVTGAEITESVTPDGTTRILRIEPDDGSPAQLITITKD